MQIFSSYLLYGTLKFLIHRKTLQNLLQFDLLIKMSL